MPSAEVSMYRTYAFECEIKVRRASKLKIRFMICYLPNNIDEGVGQVFQWHIVAWFWAYFSYEYQETPEVLPDFYCPFPEASSQILCESDHDYGAVQVQLAHKYP